MRLVLVAAFLCLALCEAAAAQGAKSLFLEELTWTELRDDIRAGKTTIIVPVGGTEQSGPHMALGKHNVRAKVLAGTDRREPRQRAGRAGHRLRARRQHRSADRAHAISRHDQHSRRRLRDDARSTRRAAFASRLSRHRPDRRPRRLPDRASPRSPPSSIANGRRRRCASHVIADYYRAARPTFAQAAAATSGFSDDEIGTHAGVADTSLTLAVDPRLVRADRLHDGTPLGAADGVHGDPRRSSAALGQIGVDLIVARTRRRDPKRRGHGADASRRLDAAIHDSWSLPS